jgi:hypothetical protein
MSLIEGVSVEPFLHPCSIMISGPSQSGKTTLLSGILRHRRIMFNPSPRRILFCYKRWQPAYDEIAKFAPEIEWRKNIPDDIDDDDFVDPSVPNCIILDDLGAGMFKDSRITSLFLEGAHHRNLSVIALVQALFQPGTQQRLCSLNSSYIIAMRSLRDKLEIANFARQFLPGKTDIVQQIFNDATKERGGYLLFDLHPGQLHSERRLRTRILPGEECFVYLDQNGESLC